jgi:hypothetical protein
VLHRFFFSQKPPSPYPNSLENSLNRRRETTSRGTVRRESIQLKRQQREFDLFLLLLSPLHTHIHSRELASSQSQNSPVSHSRWFSITEIASFSSLSLWFARSLSVRSIWVSFQYHFSVEPTFSLSWKWLCMM